MISISDDSAGPIKPVSSQISAKIFMATFQFFVPEPHEDEGRTIIAFSHHMPE